MSHLIFTPSSTAFAVTGKTFHAKEHLKKLGGKWTNGSWSLPLNADTPQNRIDLEAIVTEAVMAEKLINATKRAFNKSPAGIAEASAADLSYAKSCHWTCCDNAYVLNIKSGHVGCHTHGSFIKGILYTGD